MSDSDMIDVVRKMNERLRVTAYPFEREGVWDPTPDAGESEVDREKRSVVIPPPLPCPHCHKEIRNGTQE